MYERFDVDAEKFVNLLLPGGYGIEGLSLTVVVDGSSSVDGLQRGEGCLLLENGEVDDQHNDEAN